MKKNVTMKNLLIGSLSLVAILAFSGCGSEPKSLEELQKLSKEELKEMDKACVAIREPAGAKLLGKKPSESDLIEARESDTKLTKEREKIANEILLSRGLKEKKYGVFGASLGMVVRDFTNEEIAKFGNSDFAEFVECSRVKTALNNYGIF